MIEHERAEEVEAGSASPEPLPPAKAALSRAIDRLVEAQIRLKMAQEPLSEVRRVRAANSLAEANALKAEIQCLNEAHATEITRWIDAGAKGKRPAPPPELFDAERQLAAISAEANAAALEIVDAEGGYTAAAEKVREATVERDQAVWAATPEACAPAIESFRQAINTALKIEARLTGLVKVLRHIRDYQPVNGDGAGRAAEVLEREVVSIRNARPAEFDRGPGQMLVERLRTDPRAMLEG